MRDVLVLVLISIAADGIVARVQRFVLSRIKLFACVSCSCRWCSIRCYPRSDSVRRRLPREFHLRRLQCRHRGHCLRCLMDRTQVVVDSLGYLFERPRLGFVVVVAARAGAEDVGSTFGSSRKLSDVARDVHTTAR